MRGRWLQAAGCWTKLYFSPVVVSQRRSYWPLAPQAVIEEYRSNVLQPEAGSLQPFSQLFQRCNDRHEGYFFRSLLS